MECTACIIILYIHVAQWLSVSLGTDETLGSIPVYVTVFTSEKNLRLLLLCLYSAHPLIISLLVRGSLVEKHDL